MHRHALPVRLDLVGGLRATLRALIPHLRRKEDRAWRETSRTSVAQVVAVDGSEADVEADPINPMLVFRELPPGCRRTPNRSPDSGSSGTYPPD